jgi:hypothetical protein
MDTGLIKLKKMIADRPSSATLPRKSQVLNILQHKSVYVPWGIYVDTIGNTNNLLLIENKVLVQLIQKNNELEIHICCKMRDRANLKNTLLNYLNWFASYNWSAIYTTAPDDRKALKRMLINLGFIQQNERWVYGF